MADSRGKESKEKEFKPHSKSHTESLENTERDLQTIFKKLRVDNYPKRLKSKYGSRIVKTKEKQIKSKGIASKRQLLKEPTFTYKSIHPRRTKPEVDPDTSSWKLTTNSNDGQLESIDKKIPQTLDCKNSKLPNQDQKCASELSESCSEQFRRASRMSHGSMNFDDTTPEELAAYFDQLLHIPKAMSAMAEMMYT